MKDSTATPLRRQPTACINLKEKVGRRYKVTYEESYYADRGAGAHVPDPWLLIIPCQRGHVFPHGDNMLAASTNGRGPTAKKLVALPGVIVHQDGTDGVTVLFPPEKFAQVAKVMRPKRRRQMTPEQRQAAIERLAKYAFPPAANSQKTAPESLPTPQAVPKYLPPQRALFDVKVGT